MKIKTLVNGIRGALSLVILSSIAYTMIKDKLSSKKTNTSRFITAGGELNNS